MDVLFNFLENNWGMILVTVVCILYLMSGLCIVSEWERVPLMRWGKYVRTLEPGVAWVEPLSTKTIGPIDIRQQVLSFAMSEKSSLQTHDNVPIAFVTILTMQVDAANVKKYTLAVVNGEGALKSRTLATVSEVASRTELDALLHNRGQVSAEILGLLASRVSGWGVNILAVELRDVQITDESIQEAIAMKARAGKEADAEMVRAMAQVAIARELTLAAEELTTGGWRLKGMEVMTEMTRSADNNTVIIPSDIVQGLAKVMALG